MVEWAAEVLEKERFKHRRLDPASMTLHDEAGLRVMLTLRVDALMVTSDGSSAKQKLAE